MDVKVIVEIGSAFFLSPVSLFAVVVLHILSGAYASATIPPFFRQEIADGLVIDGNDFWYDLKNGTFVQQSNTTKYNLDDVTELAAVSYFSDGSNLNVTLWLSSPFEKIPSRYPPAYGMLINADSDRTTGRSGYDYLFQVAWDNETRSWTYDLEEWSLSREARVILLKPNYTDFYGKGSVLTSKADYNNQYVHLSLDLNKISSPERLTALFFVEYEFRKEGREYDFADFSSWVPIPPPKFEISTSPGLIELRPGQTKDVQLEIESGTSLVPQADLTAEFKKLIKWALNPNKIHVPAEGIGTSQLQISTLDHKTFAPEKLQISARIKFPSEHFPSEVFGLKSRSQPPDINGITRVERTYLTVELLPAEGIVDYINIAWETWGTPLNGFIGLVAAVVGILSVWLTKRSKSERNTEKRIKNKSVRTGNWRKRRLFFRHTK